MNFIREACEHVFGVREVSARAEEVSQLAVRALTSERVPTLTTGSIFGGRGFMTSGVVPLSWTSGQWLPLSWTSDSGCVYRGRNACDGLRDRVLA